MPKLSTDKVWFTTGKQTAFLNTVAEHSGKTTKELAFTLKRSDRTVRDWRREKYRMDYGSLKKLCQLSQMPIPKNIETRPAYSHTQAAGKRGAAAIKKKYGRHFPGDDTYRAEQWKHWWKTKGKHQPAPQLQATAIHEPVHSEDLAEFFGIVIGDGGITKYQLTITLNRTDDWDYALYVLALSKKLFKLEPRLYHDKKNNVVNICISRTKLVAFLEKNGLKRGHKIHNGVDIPKWITKNDNYLQKCLRGLFDTDGGIFLETHRKNNRQYSYLRLAFVSASKPLIETIFQSLISLSYTPKIRSGKRVQLEKSEEIKKYFSTISSSNPKHIQRLRTFVDKTIK